MGNERDDLDDRVTWCEMQLEVGDDMLTTRLDRIEAKLDRLLALLPSIR